MFSSFMKSILALVVLSGIMVSATSPLDARRSRHHKRQSIPEENIVSCDFVLQPTEVVDPSSNATDLSFEFETIISGALQGAIGSTVNSISSNFTANLDANNTFNVFDKLGAQNNTATESKEIIGGWVNSSLPGFTTNWVVRTAVCQ